MTGSRHEDQTEPKSLMWPFFMALCTLAPGGLTYTFALRESYDLSGDWVMICAPLLLFGGLCLIVFVGRLLGTIGLALAALAVLGGFGYGFYTLNEAIEDRRTHRERYGALQDAVEGYCDTRSPAPQPKAMRYKRNGKRAIYPTQLYINKLYDSSYNRFNRSYDAVFDPWDPSKPYIERVALIACVEHQTTVVDTCNYDIGSKDRQRVDLDLRLYAFKTGELVFETTLAGGEPRACQATEKFYTYGDGPAAGLKSSITGDIPSKADIFKALQPYVESKNAKKKSKKKSKKKRRKKKSKKSKKK